MYRPIRSILCVLFVLCALNLPLHAEDIGYMSSQDDNHIQLFHSDTNSVFDTIATGAAAGPMVVVDNLNQLYVCNVNSGTVSVIDTEKNVVIANVGLPPAVYQNTTLYVYFPSGIDANDDDSEVYVAAGTQGPNQVAASVFTIDTATLAVTSTQLANGTQSQGLTFYDDGVNEYIFVADWNNDQVEFLLDGVNGQTAITHTELKNPSQMTVAPSSGGSDEFLYISNNANLKSSTQSLLNTGTTVSVYNLTTKAYTTTITGLSTGPWGLLTVAADKIYLGTRSNGIIDVLTPLGGNPHTRVTTISPSAAPEIFWLGMTSDDTKVYVGDGSVGGTTITEVDTATNAETNTFSGASGVVDVEFQPAPELAVTLNNNLGTSFFTGNPSSADTEVFTFNLANNSEGDVTMTGLTLTASGTGNDLTDIAEVRLYQDLGTLATYDAGTDVQLGPAKTFDADDGTAVFDGFRLSFTSGQDHDILVVVTFSASADQSSSYIFSLEDEFDVEFEADYFDAEDFPTSGTPITGPSVFWGDDLPFLSLSEGANNPGTYTVFDTDAAALVLDLRLDASGQAVDIDDITFTVTGTGDPADVAVTLHEDTNGDGASDGVLGGPSAFTGNTVTFAGLAHQLAAGNGINFLVTFDFTGGTPTLGDTFQIEVEANADVVGTDSATNLIAAEVTGAPVNGPSVTVGDAAGTRSLAAADNTGGTSASVTNLDTNVVMLRFNLTAGTLADVQVTSVTFTASGTGDDAIDVGSVQLVRFTGADSWTILGVNLTGYSTDNGSLTFNTSSVAPIALGNTEEWGILYKFSGLGGEGATFRARLTTVVAETTEQPPQAITTSGLAITGLTASITDVIEGDVIRRRSSSKDNSPCVIGTSNTGSKGMFIVLASGIFLGLIALGRRRLTASLMVLLGMGMLLPAAQADIIYVASQNDNLITVYDSNDLNTAIGTIPIEQLCNEMIHASALERIYVSNQFSGTVTVIDTTTNAVVNTFAPFSGQLLTRGIVVNPSFTKLYVAISGSAGVDTIRVLDPLTGAETASTGNGTITSPSGIDLNAAGTHLYVGDRGNNNIAIVDTTTDQVVGTYSDAGRIVDPIYVHACDVNGTNETLFVSSFGPIVNNVPTGYRVVGINIETTPAVPVHSQEYDFGSGSNAGPYGITSNSTNTLVFVSLIGTGNVAVLNPLPIATPSVTALLSGANTSGDVLPGTLTPGIPHMIDDQTLVIPDNTASANMSYVVTSANTNWTLNPPTNPAYPTTRFATGDGSWVAESATGPSLSLSQSSSPLPAAASVPKNSDDLVLHRFTATAAFAPAEITQIEFALAMTGGFDPTVDASEFKLYLDLNNDGTVDSGDFRLGSSGVLSNVTANAALLTFDNFSVTVPKNFSLNFLVSADLTGSAADNSTLQVSLAAAGDVDAVADWTFTNDYVLTPTGTFPLQGGAQTMSALTKTLTITPGVNTPNNFTTDAADTDVVIMQINLAALGGDVVINALNLDLSGTMDDSTGFNDIQLWVDTNNDGILDNPGDSQLATDATLTDDGVVAFTFANRTITDTTDEDWIVVANFSGTANIAETTQVTFTANGDITADNQTTVTGAPIDGAVVTISAGGAPLLTLGEGGNNPADANISNFVQNHQMLHFTTTANTAANVTITAITITTSGTADESADIDSAYLLHDLNGDGNFDVDEPFVGVFDIVDITADNQSLVFTGFSEEVPLGATTGWILFYDLSGDGEVNTTLIASVDVSDITHDAGNDTGSTVTGGTQTIVSQLVASTSTSGSSSSDGSNCLIDSGSNAGSIWMLALALLGLGMLVRRNG